MLTRLIFLLSMAGLANGVNAQLQSPDDFLPHRWGETFTPHHLLVDYVQHVANNSPNVQLIEYGMTNEKRPLLLAVVSSPENLANLESIRENNLRKTGLLSGQTDPSMDKAIVWLSYSVHGNEAAGSESSMMVLYELADSKNAKTQDWLKNTIVIIDPALNPDGYSRYSHWYRGMSNMIPDPNPSVREHNEPWPGGRVNHYLFDLNRDWAWQTQVESQQRIKVYQQWMPHIHADLHEQYYHNPYYFAPAAQPYHEYITDWQGDFQIEIGKNHAKYFDQEGWLYFTREVFDLLYPSYGDTYPIFNGSIGMTYEQGGHSRGGRAILLENEDTLKLMDRVMHHKTTALSTVEIASLNAKRLVQNFEQYFANSSTNPLGEYKAYIIKGTNNKDRMKALCTLLDKNKIQYGQAKTVVNAKAYSYDNGKEKTVKVEAGDLVVSAYQPLSVLTQVLFDPEVDLIDSLTYDITAWSLPYAYGLEAYASKQKIDISPGYAFDRVPAMSADQEAYAYLGSWASIQNAAFLSALLQEGVKTRYASNSFTLDGKNYPAGTLVITRADNRRLTNFDQTVIRVAEKQNQMLVAAKTGFVEEGNDFGSDAVKLIKTPKVALLSGEDTDPNGFGQVWYYFEQVLGYPVHIFDADRIARVDLSEFNILILPEGRYRLNEAVRKQLSQWLYAGGKLIALGEANSSLADQEGFKLTEYATEEDKKAAENKSEQEVLDGRLDDYAGQERRYISTSNPGALFKLNLDTTHPLAFGLGDNYFSLKTNTLHYQLLKGAWNVGTIGEEPVVSGFVGAKALRDLKNTVVMAVEDKGRGEIIYLIDNPLFRGFWENGKLLFANALFMVGN